MEKALEVFCRLKGFCTDFESPNGCKIQAVLAMTIHHSHENTKRTFTKGICDKLYDLYSHEKLRPNKKRLRRFGLFVLIEQIEEQQKVFATFVMLIVITGRDFNL